MSTTPSDSQNSVAANVVDMAYFGELRTIQALRNCGIVPDDNWQSSLLVVKRLNHGMCGDYSTLSPKNRVRMADLQQEWRRSLKTREFGQLAESGFFTQMLDGYLTIMAEESQEKLRHLDYDPLKGEEANAARYNKLHEKEEARLKKCRDERDYYRSNPDFVKKVALQFKQLVEHESYLPIGRIVAYSGAVGQNLELAKDAVSDVLSVVAARSVMLLGRNFVDDAALERYKADPAGNQVRISAMAEKLVAATQPISALREFEQESPELDRINALKTLLSVELHHALSQERAPEHLLAVETKARERVKDAAQVSLSLSYHFLSNGPSTQDARVRTVQANLAAEMKKENIALLPLDVAQQKATQLAQAAAEDILQAISKDPKLTETVTKLAQAAGVQQPLQPKADLIGIDMLDVMKALLNRPDVVVGKDLKKFVDDLEAQRNAPTSIEVAA